MAYDTRQSGGRGYNTRGGGYPARSNAQYSQPELIVPRRLPANYVDEAERVINTLKAESNNGRLNITTSKIRAIHTLVTDIYNMESLRTEAELLEESQLKLMRLRVRIVYDAGREAAVKEFVKGAQLLEYIKGIGNSRTEMIRFAHYMEALVAYHRFLGGKDY